MKADGMEYDVEELEATLRTCDFIARFRDYGKFSALCRECPQYGKSWACPPFYRDLDAQLSRYDHILFHVSKIVPRRQDLPIALSRELLKPERMRLETDFSRREAATGGLFLGFAGSCPHCPEGHCTRPSGRPCRHPSKCHPSLEAYGFDLCKASEEVFSLPILWSRNGHIPAYLTLICGLFY